MRYKVNYVPTTLREKMIAILIYFIIMAILWLSSVVMPGDVVFESFGSLIVVSALYYVLSVLLLLLVLFAGCWLSNLTIAFLVTLVVAVFIGIPLLLVFKEFINGFWINDAGTAFVVSFVIAVATSVVSTLLRER